MKRKIYMDEITEVCVFECYKGQSKSKHKLHVTKH